MVALAILGATSMLAVGVRLVARFAGRMPAVLEWGWSGTAERLGCDQLDVASTLSSTSDGFVFHYDVSLDVVIDASHFEALARSCHFPAEAGEHHDVTPRGYARTTVVEPRGDMRHVSISVAWNAGPG